MAPKIALCLIAFTFISIQSSLSSNVTVSNAFSSDREVGTHVGTREGRSYSYPGREGWGKAYGRYGKYPYRFDRNSIDSISDSWGTKWLNQLRRRTGMTSTMDKQQMQLQMMGEEGGTADEPDMAGTFLSGWGSGYGGKSKVNKSAVGLLGFLSLLSLIQDALMNRDMMGMAMGGARLTGRKKRSVAGFTPEMIQIAQLILPVVEAVELAYKGEIPVECALHPICRGNQVLTERLGEKGKVVGTILSETFSKTLKTAGNRWKANSWDQNKVRRAGIAGRHNKNCNSLYKTCFY